MSSFLIAVVTSQTTPYPLDVALQRVSVHGLTEVVYEHDIANVVSQDLILLGRLLQIETELEAGALSEFIDTITNESSLTARGDHDVLALVVAERNIHGDWIALAPALKGPLVDFAYGMLRHAQIGKVDVSCLDVDVGDA